MNAALLVRVAAISSTHNCFGWTSKNGARVPSYAVAPSVSLEETWVGGTPERNPKAASL